MKFQQPRRTGPAMSERQMLEHKFTLSRHNLLIVVAFTLLNIVMLLLKSDTYMLFAASIPYYLVLYGMMFTGKFPEEWYGGEMEEYAVFNDSFFVITLVIALICLLFYMSFWFFSRKGNGGWLIAALVFIVLDTVGMFVLVGFDVSMLLDVLFHGWIIYEMCVGIHAAKKLKTLPPDDLPPSEDDPFAYPADPNGSSDDPSDKEN